MFQPVFSQPDTYYIFNHVDLTITYHGGKSEPWGAELQDNIGRILSILNFEIMCLFLTRVS
jgi:transmembrane 9 superfamily protein 2/4